jgi:hypothetical protein
MAVAISMTACQSTQTSQQRIQMTDGTPVSKLHLGQNAEIYYLLEDDTRRYKHCKIISADDYWLTVADKAVKTAESDELSGWHSMIPIKNIVLIRVELDSE